MYSYFHSRTMDGQFDTGVYWCFSKPRSDVRPIVLKIFHSRSLSNSKAPIPILSVRYPARFRKRGGGGGNPTVHLVSSAFQIADQSSIVFFPEHRDWAKCGSWGIQRSQRKGNGQEGQGQRSEKTLWESVIISLRWRLFVMVWGCGEK